LLEQDVSPIDDIRSTADYRLEVSRNLLCWFLNPSYRPKVREALGLEVGDRLAFEVRDDGVVEIHPETIDVLSLCGTIKPKIRGVSIEQMNKDIARSAGRK
jgi:hypothetical protein